MKRLWLLVPFLIFLTPQFVLSDVIVVDFESFNDGDFVTTEIPGVTFTNVAVLSAGISLNEFEFPPHSGVNVAFDASGPISIAFTNSIVNFGGFFNYAAPITLQAFDAANNLVSSISSAFNSNLGLAGDAGSAPNEFLSLAFAGGFNRVDITGDAFGGSLTFDDATYTSGGGGPVTVPGPSSLLLLVAGIALLLFVQRRRPDRYSV